MPTVDPTLDWLLDREDPGVRYFALRDLLDAPEDDPEVRKTRRAVARATPVREILAAQEAEGFWIKPGHGYAPKYTGTVWQVIFLGQFGAPAEDRRVRRGGDYVLEHSRAPAGGFTATIGGTGMIHCLQGNLGSSLLQLGFEDDPRLQESLEWSARSITGEGIAPAIRTTEARRFYRSGTSGPGFRCAANNHQPCAWGAVPALEALSRIPPRRRTPPIRRALIAGAKFLLSHDPAVADYPMGWSAKPNGSWFKFGYPLGYVGDVLRNVEVLIRLGFGSDRRLRRAAELILAKRTVDGRWPLEYTYNGKTWADVEHKGRPSKWVTLRARRALRGMGVEG
jgi:hypothetical protein